MASNPLDAISSPVAPQQQARRPIPRTIMGPPREPPPQTPVNAARDAVGLESDRQSIENARLAAERARLQIQQDRRTASDPAGDAPATQRRDAGFYLRAARSNGLYERHQVEPRGVVGQTLADAFPRLANTMTDSERQMAEAAQGDFIGATLRYESGAAVPPAEFEMQRVRYFPQPGDSPEVIAFKAELRRNAIEALQRSAGQAASGIDPNPLSDTGGSPGYQLGQHVVPAAAAALAGSASGGQPPPQDPNRVRPGESTGQVGTLPIGPPDTGRMEVSTGDEYRAQINNRAMVAAQFRAAYARGADRDELIRIMEQAGPLNVDQRAWIDANTTPTARRYWRQHGNSILGREWFGQNEQMSGPRSTMAAVSASPAGTFAINAADAASLGLPGLFSEDYRDRLAEVRARSPGISIAGSLAGGMLAPGGPRAGMSIGGQSLRSAGQGAAYGFNSSGGDVENALVGGGIGAALPGAFNIAGRGLRTTRNFLAPRANVADPEAQALASAFNEEGVPASRPLLDPASRDRMAYLESSVGSGRRIREGLQATRSGIEARAGELGGTGTVEPNGVIGQRIQDAGERYITRSGDIRSRMYNRAAQMAGDAPVYGRDAVQAIDDMLAELAPNAPINQGQITYLQNLRSTFVDDAGNLIPRSVAGIRDLRTEMRTHIDNGSLTRGPAERRVLNVLSAARQDIERDLGASNPAAVRAYQRADRFTAERAAEIRQVVQRVIGRRDDKLSGERVMANLRTMAGNRGDADRLGRLWQKLSPEEQADAAATIASTAGRRTAEEGFEPGQFIAWARTLSPEARQTIFGPEGARSIANLRAMSKALTDTTSRLNNSRTGVVTNWRGLFRDLITGGPAGAVLGAASGGSALTTGITGAAVGGAAVLTGLGLRKLSARAIMNPDISRWLAAAPRASTPSAIRAHIERLQPIARLQRNQAVAQEIIGLRQALLNAVNDNLPQAGRMAASPNEGPDNADQ